MRSCSLGRGLPLVWATLGVGGPECAVIVSSGNKKSPGLGDQDLYKLKLYGENNLVKLASGGTFTAV